LAKTESWEESLLLHLHLY